MLSLTVLARAIHFAAIVSLTGIFVFRAVVAEPVLARGAPSDAAGFRRALRHLAWLSLAVALLSGALWLTVEARSMSRRWRCSTRAPRTIAHGSTSPATRRGGSRGSASAASARCW